MKCVYTLVEHYLHQDQTTPKNKIHNDFAKMLWFLQQYSNLQYFA